MASWSDRTTGLSDPDAVAISDGDDKSDIMLVWGTISSGIKARRELPRLFAFLRSWWARIPANHWMLIFFVIVGTATIIDDLVMV